MNIYRQVTDHHKNYNIIQVNKWNGYELYKQEKKTEKKSHNTTNSISKTYEQLWTNTTNTILHTIYSVYVYITMTRLTSQTKAK